MSFKEKLQKRYAQAYIQKYGDRISQFQGNVISVKIEEKAILWIFHTLKAIILVRPERSRSVVKCVYKKNRWFKKPIFISISQGNLILVQGLKSAKKKKKLNEQIDIINIRNISTKKDLVPIKGEPKVQRIQRPQKFK